MKAGVGEERAPLGAHPFPQESNPVPNPVPDPLEETRGLGVAFPLLSSYLAPGAGPSAFSIGL